MSTMTRFAVRLVQILTLALVLVGLAGGTKVARAADEADCEESASWVEETLERYEVLEEHGQDLMNVTSIQEAQGLLYHTIGLYADAADDQADSNPPADLEEMNDDLVWAYDDVSHAVQKMLDASAALDQKDVIEATEELTAASKEVLDSITYVQRLDEDCEEIERDRGRDRDRDRDNEDDPREDDPREAEVEVEIEATIVDAETEDPIEDALFIILAAGVEIDDFDQRAFAEGDRDQVLAVATSDEDGKISFEVEVEIDGEYTVILAHEDYQNLRYWSELVFATDDDAETVEFGAMTLSNE